MNFLYTSKKFFSKKLRYIHLFRFLTLSLSPEHKITIYLAPVTRTRLLYSVPPCHIHMTTPVHVGHYVQFFFFSATDPTIQTHTESPSELQNCSSNCWVMHPVARVSTNTLIKPPYATNVFLYVHFT
jgi:hypothetical protein